MTNAIQNKFWHVAATLLAAAVLVASFSFAHAQTAVPATITAWFEALENNDPGTIDTLLDDSAVIVLEDLGISQNKNEFIASLDQWAEVNGDVNISTIAKAVDGENVQMEVCYRFSSNAVLMIETFEMSNNKITKSVQRELSDDC